MGATLLGSVSTAKKTSTPDSTEKREVRLEFLRSKEIKQAQAACEISARRCLITESSLQKNVSKKSRPPLRKCSDYLQIFVYPEGNLQKGKHPFIVKKGLK
jgi:hypothetical protein